MNEIESAAYRAWDVFYSQLEERFRIYTGRKQFWTHKFQKAFTRIGEICVKNHFDIFDYIATSLELLNRRHDYITPKDFTTQDAIDMYVGYKRVNGNEAEKEWLEQIRALTQIEVRLIPELYESEAHVLMNVNMSFRAWFRVLYPEKFNEVLFKMFGQLAWEEIQVDYRLLKFLRKKVPDKILELENRIGQLAT